jgi:hypothetical protein
MTVVRTELATAGGKAVRPELTRPTGNESRKAVPLTGLPNNHNRYPFPLSLRARVSASEGMTPQTAKGGVLPRSVIGPSTQKNPWSKSATIRKNGSGCGALGMPA